MRCQMPKISVEVEGDGVGRPSGPERRPRQEKEVRQRSGLSLSQQSQGSKRHLWTEAVSRYLPITCLGTWEPRSYTT